MSENKNFNEEKVSKKLSGSAFRKRAQQRQEREKELLNKVPKLESFFNITPSRNIIKVALQDDTNDSIANENVFGIEEGFPSTSTSLSCTNKTPNENPSTNTSFSEDKSCQNTDSDAQFSISTSVDNCSNKSLNENSKAESHYEDPALWEVNEGLREHIANNGFVQNENSDFSKSVRIYSNNVKRFLSKSVFFKDLANGERVKRSHLVYSKSTGNLFCAPCKLYCGSTALATSGFNDWKNSYLIQEHDNSHEHRDCMSKFIRRGSMSERIDSGLQKQYREEVNYWRNVLLRVVEVVKFLASRGLSFHGDNEILGSSRNGNFLGCIELLGKFDPFIADHVARFGNKGRGTPSYLSSKIVDEFIFLLASEVKHQIIQEVKTSKYFSIIIDSTPDVAHIDQLTFVLRYVNSTGDPVERFITFLPNCGHKGEEMSKSVISLIQSLGLNLSDCKGQSYDNASNMSGKYKGVQARIKELNSSATFVPCAGHSLQLVGSAAAESSESSVAFFSMVQQLYNFFTSSTKRWEVLQSHLNKDSFSLKTLSKTRWSARADASRAIYTSYSEVVSTLLEISTSCDHNKDTQNEAKLLAGNIKSLEMAIMMCVWNDILSKFQVVSEKLQGEYVDLNRVIILYGTLESFLILKRDKDEFTTYEAKAKRISGCEVYKKDSKRAKKIKVPYGEKKEGHTQFDGRNDFFVNSYLIIIDELQHHLAKRKEVYCTINQRFGFLWTMESIKKEEIKTLARELLQIYNTDIDEAFIEECLHLKEFLMSSDYVGSRSEESESVPNESQNIQNENVNMENSGVKNVGIQPHKLLKLLRRLDVISVFPNVEIILRIFLSMAVTNCSGERSFSALKRVKSFLRSTLGQEKTDALSILFIESEFLSKVTFDKIVQEFAEAKSRKQQFL